MSHHELRWHLWLQPVALTTDKVGHRCSVNARVYGIAVSGFAKNRGQEFCVTLLADYV